MKKDVKLVPIVYKTPKIVDKQQIYGYAPLANHTVAGLSKYSEKDFYFDKNGKVRMRYTLKKAVNDIHIDNNTIAIEYSDGISNIVELPTIVTDDAISRNIIKAIDIQENAWIANNDEYILTLSSDIVDRSDDKYFVIVESKQNNMYVNITPMLEYTKFADGSLSITSYARFAGRVLLFDSSVLTNINTTLVNGSGLYSLVSLEDATRANYAYGRADLSIGHKNKTYQRDSVAIGGGITTGMTEDEFNNYYWDFDNNVAKNGGKGTSSNNILDDTGTDYEGSYGFCFTIGSSNVNKGRASFLGGENNNNHGKDNFNYGQGINNFGNYSVMLGGDQVSQEAPSRIDNKGNYNFFFGKTGLSSYSDQFHKECNNVVLLGENLRATNDNQVIVGANSGFAYEDIPNLRFAVATGSTPESGFNGLEVYKGGSVRVYKKPTTSTEVARLAEINELNDEIANLSSGANISVLTQEQVDLLF